MLVKVLQILQTKLIVSTDVVRDTNNLVVRYTKLLVLGREVVLASKDNKGWDSPPLRVDALDDAGPLSVALLHCLWLSSTLRACNNSSC